MSLLIFLLLHQIVLVNGASTYSVKITRVIFRGKQEDSFELPKSYAWCSSQNECNRFNANLSPSGSLKHSCLCSCSRLMAATFGVKNGSWSCIGNKEIRDRELDECERILLFDNEKETDPLRMLKTRQRAALNISANIQCNTAGFGYQECDGRWTTLINALPDWGLQVTKERLNSDENYVLKIDDAPRSNGLHGKIMKLAIPCGSEKPFCWLFKVAGEMKCPLKHILTNKPPEPKSTATTTTTTTKRKSAFFEAVTSTVHSANSVPKSHVVPIVTGVPSISVVSTTKATNTWVTDSDVETIDEGSNEVPIVLVIGVAGAAVIVLLIALLFGLLMRRKRRESHNKPSTSVELKTTNTDSSIVQYASVKEKSRYLGLSPSPDGAMERGVYVPRYKVPETDVNNMGRPVEGPNNKPVCDEYDYAKSSLVVRNNVLKFSFPLSNEKTSHTPDDNAPFYHVLDGEDKGLENKEPSEGDCGKPVEGAPYYRVLEEPNPLDQEGNFHETENQGRHDIPGLDPYYHILEEPKDDEQKGPDEVAHESGAYYYAVNGAITSSDSQGGCGYKDLQSDGRVPTGYQTLHKYSYVACGDSSESP